MVVETSPTGPGSEERRQRMLAVAASAEEREQTHGRGAAVRTQNQLSAGHPAEGPDGRAECAARCAWGEDQHGARDDDGPRD